MGTNAQCANHGPDFPLRILLSHFRPCSRSLLSASSVNYLLLSIEKYPPHQKGTKRMNCDKISTNKFNICGDAMLIPEVVDRILTLSSMGLGKKAIAKELGISSRTARRYLSQKGWQPYKSPKR
mgnify:CR=1 FL=1